MIIYSSTHQNHRYSFSKEKKVVYSSSDNKHRREEYYYEIEEQD